MPWEPADAPVGSATTTLGDDAVAAGIKAAAQLSALQLEEKRIRELLLRNERSVILKKMSEHVVAFDEALYELRKERMVRANSQMECMSSDNGR